MSTQSLSRRSEPAGVIRDTQSGGARLINEDLFRGVLVRERKRADRSNQALMVVLVTLSEESGLRFSMAWLKVIEALAAAKRETDVLGWFERGVVVGAILPEVPASDANFFADFTRRLRLELERRLDAESLEHVSIRLHVHPAPGSAATGAVQSIDPLLGSEELRSSVYEDIKRGLDIAGSLVLLLLTSPLFLLLAALVKFTSPGPVFFRQTRVGQMRKPFTCLKFRTMHVNNDDAIHKQFVSSFIKSGPQAQEAGKKGVFKITNDPRITAVGNLLRKTSLDELPQLWNVFRGDMSLVGPRPPVPYEVEQYQPWHCRRVLEAKPGITGLWQVNGRSRTTFDEMVRLDLRYAKACSLWTDVRILLATPKAVIAGKGAC
jgi:exopolysaccharide biosynthesis polyprenyl glycosylphosphotransferase